MATSGWEWPVEPVYERMPDFGILLLERVDPDAAARCWSIIADWEWENRVRQDA
jgi:hypothetical protein